MLSSHRAHDPYTVLATEPYDLIGPLVVIALCALAAFGVIGRELRQRMRMERLARSAPSLWTNGALVRKGSASWLIMRPLAAATDRSLLAVRVQGAVQPAEGPTEVRGPLAPGGGITWRMQGGTAAGWSKGPVRSGRRSRRIYRRSSSVPVRTMPNGWGPNPPPLSASQPLAHVPLLNPTDVAPTRPDKSF